MARLYVANLAFGAIKEPCPGRLLCAGMRADASAGLPLGTVAAATSGIGLALSYGGTKGGEAVRVMAAVSCGLRLGKFALIFKEPVHSQSGNMGGRR